MRKSKNLLVHTDLVILKVLFFFHILKLFEIIPAENPDNDNFTRRDCLPEILLDFGRQKLSQLAGWLVGWLADWLAGWPGKPDYVVLKAVLGQGQSGQLGGG